MPITPGEFTTEAKTTASTSITLAAPANLVAGDLLYMQCSINGGLVNSAPAGWTQRVSNTGVSNPRVFAYSKVAVAEDVGATFIFGLSASITSGSVLRRFSGVDGTTPHDVTAAVLASGAAATSGTVPSLTTATADALLLGGMGINSSSTAITAPTGMTETAEVGGKKHEADFEQRPTAGATGTRTWTFGASREFAGFLDALRPAAGGAATVTGAAALSADGGLTAVAGRTTFGAAALSADGAVAATAQVTTFASAALSANGGLVVAVGRTTFAAAALVGDASLTAAGQAGTPEVIGIAALSAGTSLVAAGSVTVFATTQFSAGSELLVSALVGHAAAASLGASGGMTAIARLTLHGSVGLAASSSMTARGVIAGTVSRAPSFILSRHRLRPVTTQVFF